MMDDREKQRRKRERLRIQREQRRQRMIGLVWGLITVLAVFAVLFIGLSVGSHEASAATNETFDGSLDTDLSVGEAYESPTPLRHDSLGVIEPIEFSDPPVHSGKGCKWT